MGTGRARRRVAIAFAVVALLGTECVAVGAAGAAPDAPAGAVRPHEPKLSERLARLASPALASASHESQARGLGLPDGGAGSLMRRGRDRVLVYVELADTSDAKVAGLGAAGARVTHVSAGYRTVTAEVPITSLRRVADAAGVVSMQEALAPFVDPVGGSDGPAPVTAAGSCAPIVSEGDTQLKAALARATYGVDGTGIKVGILSDSFATAPAPATTFAQDVANDDLPGPANPCGHTTAVQVLQDWSGGTDEGRAMAQIVHDLAPGATIAFGTAFAGEYAFADQIVALRDAGASVIVDDVSYFDEPYFQDGPVSQAVKTVTASGVSYLSSAGNSNAIVGGNNVGSYESTFRSASCPTIAGYVTSCHDFNSTSTVDNTHAFTIANGARFSVQLQWAEPWFGVTDDLDMYLLDSGGNVIAWSEGDQLGGSSQEPFESLGVTNSTGTSQSVRLVIDRYSGSGSPRLKILYAMGSDPIGVEYPTSSGSDVVGPAIFGHNGADATISVGAVPYSSTTTPEPFTSHGPVRLHYGPVVGTTPAAPLGAVQTLAKPDLAATDGGQNSFFGSNAGVWRFYGTSAAAPHAAAVVALMRQLDPAATRATIESALVGSGRPVGTAPATTVGSGLIDAQAALAALTPSVTLTAPNGGGSCTTGVTCAISWTSVGDVGDTVTLELLAGGVVNATIADAAPTGAGGGSFDWTVPDSVAPATNYRVRVTSSAPGAFGAADTSDADFAIASTPAVTNVSPSSGPLTAAPVTVTGANFRAGGTTVRFGTTVASGVSVVSSTELTVTAPARSSAGKVDVFVTTAGGTSANTSADDYTYFARPMVSSLTPAKGDPAGGNSVVIAGSNLAVGLVTVTFGGVPASIVTHTTTTSMTVTAPAHALGVVDVVVTTPGGSNVNGTGDNYTYALVPAVTNVSPSSGPLTAAPVTVTGTNFVVGGTTVRFGTTTGSSVNVVSPTELTVTAPARSSAGRVDVFVMTAGGTSANTSADDYTYFARPMVSSLTPAKGDPAGGNGVVIAGSNLAVGLVTVTFGGVPADVVSHTTTTSMTVTAPAHALGVVDVVVTTPGGSNVNGTGDNYTYALVPSVTGVAPVNGPLTAQSVMVTGTNFVVGGTTVRFGTTVASGVSVVSSTELTVTAPARSSAGKVDVTVTTTAGTSANTSADDYTYFARPSVTGLSPATGDEAGGNSVVIAGSNLAVGLVTVTFGGVPADVVSHTTTTSMTVTAPAHALGVVDVVVTTPGGSNVNGTGDNYTYTATVVGTASATGSGALVRANRPA